MGVVVVGETGGGYVDEPVSVEEAEVVSAEELDEPGASVDEVSSELLLPGGGYCLVVDEALVLGVSAEVDALLEVLADADVPGSSEEDSDALLVSGGGYVLLVDEAEDPVVSDELLAVVVDTPEDSVVGALYVCDEDVAVVSVGLLDSVVKLSLDELVSGVVVL